MFLSSLVQLLTFYLLSQIKTLYVILFTSILLYLLQFLKIFRKWRYLGNIQPISAWSAGIGALACKPR